MRARHLLLPVATVLPLVPLLTTVPAARAEQEHVVTSVANGFVYFDLGTRDGAAVGRAVEVVGVGTIELDLCGEVICRGRLAPGMKEVARGMSARLAIHIGTGTTTPSASETAAPPSSASADTSTSNPPTSTTVPSKKKKKKPVIAAPAPNEVKPATTTPDGPVRMDAPPEGAAPPGYRRVSKPQPGQKTFGWLTLGTSYVIAAIAGPDDFVLSVPVAGPFLRLAIPDGAHKHGTEFLVIDGLFQAGGLGLLIWAYAQPKYYFLRNDIRKVFFHVTPVVASHTWGVAVEARF